MAKNNRSIEPVISEIEIRQRYLYNSAQMSGAMDKVLNRIKGSHEQELAAAQCRTSGAVEAASKSPTSNTGGKSIKHREQVRDLLKMVVENGELKGVPNSIPRPEKVAFIDWVNFTAHESSFFWSDNPIDDNHVINQISHVLEWIFGFGITHRRDKGANFYKTAFDILSFDGLNYGMVCHGGQQNTVLVMIRGEGCHAAKIGWENRLKQFLEISASGRITRIDLAYDDFSGESLSVDDLEQAYEQGGFNMGGRNPDIELRGNWKNINGKGRTVYVGNRGNGKFFRGYEKGKQLGDKESPWVRLEVEIKSVDRHIPFDVLLRPGDYMAAQYPVLNFISQRQDRIATVSKTVQKSYSKMMGWLRHQCGAALNVALQVEGDAEKLLKQIVREGKTPKGLLIPDYKACADRLSSRVVPSMPLDAVLSM